MWRAARSLAAGTFYFLAMAGARWVFGPVREFYVRSGLSPLLAVLIEAPAMVVVTVFASTAAIRWLGVRDRAGDRLLMGVRVTRIR